MPLGMVERILSTAKLHRCLLEVPSLTIKIIEVRYNSTKWLAVIPAMREMEAVEKHRIPVARAGSAGYKLISHIYVCSSVGKSI